MFLQYFGFREDPFGTTPDSRYLYPSQTHREALASLKYGFLSNRGFTAMIAPPGRGKTTLLFRFLNEVRESARAVFLFDIEADCEPREFVGYILRDIGITPAQTSSERHEQLTEALVKENRAGRKFVVVIDEAQNLSDAVLERVRLLSNFETSRGKLLQIVLSGQPQLSEKLLQASLVQLRQRISTICRIEPLTADETAAYIDYRLKQAGYDGEPLFTQDALKLIAKASDGVPRVINNLCFNALSICCALKGKQVDDGMVSEVIADLQLGPQSREPTTAETGSKVGQATELKQQKRPNRLLRSWIPASAIVLVLCALAVAWLTGYRIPWSYATTDGRFVNEKLTPTPVQAPATTDNSRTIAVAPPPNTSPFSITVKPDQRLQDISNQYLGGWDLRRLHQIQKLNPKLTDPDHIEVGQKIWLPGPPPVSIATNATSPVSVRDLQ